MVCRKSNRSYRQLLKTNDNGELSIAFEHVLDGNFCGNIIKFNIQKETSGGNSTGGETAVLSIFVPNNFNDIEDRVIENLNEYRNKIHCSIQYYDMHNEEVGEPVEVYINEDFVTEGVLNLFTLQTEEGLNLNRQPDINNFSS